MFCQIALDHQTRCLTNYALPGLAWGPQTLMFGKKRMGQISPAVIHRDKLNTIGERSIGSIMESSVSRAPA